MFHFLAEVAPVLSICLSLGIASLTSDLAKPRLTFDATAFGWQPAVTNHDRFEYEWGVVDSHRVVFDSTGNIYVGFNIRSSHEIQGVHLPYQFRVLGVDGESGELQENLTFGSGNQRRNSLYSCGGGLIVNANDTLREIHGEERRQLQLPNETKGEYNILDETPRRRLLVTLRSPSHSSEGLLDCSILKVAPQCDLSHPGLEAETFIDTSTIVERRAEAVHTSTLFEADFCGTPRPLMTVRQPVVIRALSASEMLLLSFKTMWVQSASTGKIVEYTAGRDQSFNPYKVRISEDGRYAVFAVLRTQSGKFFDQDATLKSVSIAICDLHKQQSLETINVSNSLLDADSDFDINRNGSQLAIFSSGLLQVIAVAHH